jgi:rod shape-determining protein MreD
MMRFVFCFILAIALLVAQGVLRHLFLPEWLLPQGLLICAVFLAFYEFSLLGAIAAFLLGFLLDLSSGVLLGPWAAAYVVVYGVFALLSQRLFVESRAVAMTVVAIGTLLSGIVFLSLAFEYQAVTLSELSMLAGQAVASALLTPFVFKVLKFAWRRPDRVLTGRGAVVSAV